MSDAAFEDLELDFSDMMTNPTAFAKRVNHKAEELREGLKEDQSTAALMRRFKEIEKPADTSIHVLLNAVYNMADEELPLEQMPAIMTAVKKLMGDLETLFDDLAIRHLASESKSITNKKVLHAQYVTLRERFNDYADFMNGFMKQSIEKLPSLPGNYGRPSSGLKHYVFEYNGEQYRNPRALCRKIGIEPISMYDKMLEYLDEHPEHDVLIKEVM